MGSTLDNVRDSIMSNMGDTNNKVKKKLSLKDYRGGNRASSTNNNTNGNRFQNQRNNESNGMKSFGTNNAYNNRYHSNNDDTSDYNNNNNKEYRPNNNTYNNNYNNNHPQNSYNNNNYNNNNSNQQNSYSSNNSSNYNTKYRTGTDFKGLPWPQVPNKIAQLVPNGKEIKLMWVPNNSTFDKFTELSFDAIVRRESVYKYRMKKVSVNNFSAYQEIMEQFNESFVNKMLIMENGEAGQEEVEEKVNYLTNEFVLEIEEKNNEENGSPIDILSWTVEVTDVPGNNLKLLSFDNEMFCQLTFKIFQEKWKLQRLNSYNEKNATIKINTELTNDLNVITSFIHSEIEYKVFKKKNVPKKDIIKDTIFYKLNNKYPQMKPTKILVLYNMISIQDLKNEDLFNKIKTSIHSQRNKLLEGSVQIEIPRPGIDMMFNDVKEYFKNGLTKVFIKFDSLDSSIAAFEKLDGWCFQGRKVLLGFYDEKDFDNGIYI